jgi:hypothetical protein
MTSKTTFLLLGLCLFCAQLWSQAFAPLGAQWHYRPFELSYPGTHLYRYTVTKDTLLDGRQAREIAYSEWQSGQFSNIPQNNHYVATHADSVLYRVGDAWSLLFDFSAQVGDTIRSKVEGYNIASSCIVPDTAEFWNLAYRIDSVAVVVVNGISLRLQYVHSFCDTDACWSLGSPGGTGKIMERIGGVDTEFWWGQGTLCLTGGFPGYFRCYQDNEVQYKGNIGTTACDYVGTNEWGDLHVLLWPNLTTGQVQLSFSPLPGGTYYRVLDATGRLLETGAIQAGTVRMDLDFSMRQNGMYFVELVGRAGRKVFRVVKI